jgi:uncharacterized protein YcbX
MLLEVLPNGLKNMAVSSYPLMTQFLTKIHVDAKGNGHILVTFKSPGSDGKYKELEVPLTPDPETLESLPINMHSSPTEAFKMPDSHSKWFSECFGFEVIFAYVGENRRRVLFPDVPSASWTSTIAKSIPLLSSSFSVTDHRIGFADCAPYLITSETSLADVSNRLPEGQTMDMTKFRPNIVIEGAGEAWEEDYWRKIKVAGADMVLMHNCIRCKSINIDYATGKPGTNESGEVLKKLQKDRRVDKGSGASKYSPVFGRYGFWGEGRSEKMLRVGDKVTVMEVNQERTVFCMPSCALFTTLLIYRSLAWSISSLNSNTRFAADVAAEGPAKIRTHHSTSQHVTYSRSATIMSSSLPLSLRSLRRYMPTKDYHPPSPPHPVISSVRIHSLSLPMRMLDNNIKIRHPTPLHLLSQPLRNHLRGSHTPMRPRNTRRVKHYIVVPLSPSP